MRGSPTTTSAGASNVWSWALRALGWLLLSALTLGLLLVATAVQARSNAVPCVQVAKPPVSTAAPASATSPDCPASGRASSAVVPVQVTVNNQIGMPTAAAAAASAASSPAPSRPSPLWRAVHALAWLLCVPLALVCLWRAWRAMLTAMAFHRARLREDRADGDDRPLQDHIKLMGSQRSFVEDFLKELDDGDETVLSGKLYAIKGVWGSGKSTVVTAIRRELERRLRLPLDDSGLSRRYIPLYMNAWREETPDDLHFRMVEHIAMHSEVLKVSAPVLTSRFLVGLVKGRPLKRHGGWLSAVFKGSGKAKAVVGEAALEAEAKWERPTPLDFQEDLDRMMAALRRHGVHLVLVVDEIERGTRQSAQAMALLLKRSFDYPHLHLVVPYVPHVMEALVFNPISQASEELRTATEAVLLTHDGLRKKAMAEAARTYVDKSVWPPGDRVAVPADEREPHRVFRTALIRGFYELDLRQRRPLQNLMQEKYFGFSREVPRPTMADLAEFVLAQGWLRSTLGGLAMATLLTDAFGITPAEAQATVADAVRAPGADTLRTLLAEDLERLADLSAMSFGPGEFSVRSFEGQLRRLLANWAAAPQAVGWSVRDYQPDVDSSERRDAMMDFLATVLAHAALVAVGLMRQSLGQTTGTDSSTDEPARSAAA